MIQSALWELTSLIGEGGRATIRTKREGKAGVETVKICFIGFRRMHASARGALVVTMDMLQRLISCRIIIIIIIINRPPPRDKKGVVA